MQPSKRGASIFAFLAAALGAVILTAGCAGRQSSPSPAPTEVLIRLNGRWGPASQIASRDQLIGGLMFMLKANENTEAELCTPEAEGRKCRKEAIRWFVQGGPIPGIASYKKPYMTQVALNRTDYAIQFKLDATVRWIGTPVFCTDALTTLTVDPAFRVSMKSNTTCTWTAFFHVWEIRYQINRIDFDSSEISGRYTVAGAGALTIGGGSGDFLLRFPKAGVLTAGGDDPATAVLPEIARLPAEVLAAPLPKETASKAAPAAADEAEREMWETAGARNTADAFAAYLGRYPQGRFASAAETRLRLLKEREARDREVAFWSRIKENGSEDDYQTYLNRYPDGMFRDAAGAHLRRMRAAAEEAAALQSELALWEKVKGSTDPEQLESYLERYPSGQFSQPARTRLDKLARAAAESENLEFKMWNRVKESRDIGDYQGFLQIFPDGVFADIARSRIEILAGTEAQAEEARLWDRIRNSSDPKDFREYLTRYPSGRYAQHARKMAGQLEELRSERAELEMWQAVRNSAGPEAFDRYLEAYPQGRFSEEALRRREAARREKTLGGIDFGRYHALVIGNNGYRHLPRLSTAAKDARSVAGLLEHDYGYAVELLLDAGRKEIIDALSRYRARLTKGDNFLLYYAGHGWLDRETGRGYWLPIDAERQSPANWISTGDISDTLKAMPAKHVMVVADSCYSGTLTRAVKIGALSKNYLQRLAGMRTRVVLSSGGLEPVLDTGGGEHSVFAEAFLRVLKENSAVLEGTRLFDRLREAVVRNAPQTPEYSDILYAGHEGGDFLFVRRR